MGRALALGLVAGGIIAVAVIARLGMLPTTWLALIAAGALLIAAAVGLGLWLTKAPPHWIRFGALALTAVIGITAEAAVLKGFLKYNAFYNATAPALPTENYSVIAPNAHPDNPESLTREVIGELIGDPNKDTVEAHLADKFKTTFATCSDPTDLASQLTAGRFDAAVLDSDLYAAYEEGDPEFFESTQVIYTFDVQTAMSAPSAASTARAGDSFIVYISGIDTGGPISRVSRSDVNILMAVNPDTGKVLLVNTPRDYYVQLHGTEGSTKDKLTHAGNFGVQMSIDTLQDLYGIEIDYYARVNFSSLIEMVDLVGGIDVDSPVAFRAGGVEIQEGINHLDGVEALAFARERHAFSAGDRMRGMNQQRVIAALIAKASERSNLLRYNELLTALADAMEMNVPQQQIANLVKQRLQDSQAWQVESISVDGAGDMLPTYSMGSMKLYVMVPDQATIDAAKTKIKATLGG
jgi:LCP family protein required for cell wall assembly